MEDGLRVLVVDEEGGRRELYERVLAEQGYDVVVVEDSKKAVQEVKRQNFNLAFIEVEMPRMVGLLTSMALKEIHPDLEVVMMAGYGVEEQLRQVIRAGIRDSLTQPMEALEIISNLDSSRHCEPHYPGEAISFLDCHAPFSRSQ